MQAKLQEIRDRLDKATIGPWEITANGICECPLCNGNGQVDFTDISGDGWVALAQTYGIGDMIVDNAKFIANSPADIKFLLDALEQSQNEITELYKILDQNHNTIEIHDICAQQSQGRERVLRDFIDTEFCTNFKKYGKTTMCHHPDNGMCGKYYNCRALHEALKEDKPND